MREENVPLSAASRAPGPSSVIMLRSSVEDHHRLAVLEAERAGCVFRQTTRSLVPSLFGSASAKSTTELDAAGLPLEAEAHAVPVQGFDFTSGKKR